MPKRTTLATKGPDAAEDDEFLLCLDYIKHVEWERKSKDSFAEKHDVNRTTVWQWQIRWGENGLLRKARQYLGRVLFDDIIVSNRRAAGEWNMLLDEAMRIAMRANSDFTKLQAIQWLYEKIIQPMMDEQEEGEDEEARFITMVNQSPRFLNPMSVAEEEEQDEEDEDDHADDVETSDEEL